MRLRWAIISFLAMLVATSLAYGASAARLPLGYSAIASTMAPLWAGRDIGSFAKYGIEAELIYLAGGSRIALALESDSIQIGQIALNAGIEARLAGGDATIIGSVYDTYYFQIFGKSAIANPARLKGKVVAASSAGSASDYGIRKDWPTRRSSRRPMA